MDATGQFRFIEYATPEDVPLLMAEWLLDLNRSLTSWPIQNAAVRYADLHQAFVRIHPFCDGNGRMARLLANLPLLRVGLPPILIPRENRIDYIRLPALYDIEIGPARAFSLQRAITSLSGPSVRLPSPWWMPCSRRRAKPKPGIWRITPAKCRRLIRPTRTRQCFFNLPGVGYITTPRERALTALCRDLLRSYKIRLVEHPCQRGRRPRPGGL